MYIYINLCLEVIWFKNGCTFIEAGLYIYLYIIGVSLSLYVYNTHMYVHIINVYKHAYIHVD